MQTFAALWVTLLFYLMLTFSSLGWGRVLVRLSGIRASWPGGIFSQIWLGWCGILFLLQFCHFLVPLDIYSSTVVYGSGLFLGARSYLSWNMRSSSEIFGRIGRFSGLALLLFAVWVALRAMNAPDDFDSGLYHFNAIRWINEYAIVPGLGNLQNRLAFNCAYLPFVASLNFYPWFNHGHNIGLSWLLLLMTAECFFASGRVWKAFRDEKEPAASDLCPALLLPYLLYISCTMDLSSPQSDHASCLVRLTLYFYLWRNLIAKNKTEILVTTKFLLIYGITATTIKMSNLAFAGTACLVAILHCWTGESRSLGRFVKDLRPPILIGMLILLTWLACGVVTSGYPLYPSTFLGFHTDWTINPVSAKRTAAWVFSWARCPFKEPALVLRDWEWLRPWSLRVWQTQQTEVILPVEIFLATAFIVLASVLRGRSTSGSFFRRYLGLLPVLAGLAFWFYLAPDTRFADGLFWLLPLAVFICYLANETSIEARRNMLLLATFVMCLPLALSASPVLTQIVNFSDCGWRPIKKAPLIERVTAQGLKFYIPRESNQQGWDSPLPGTPYFDPTLQLRGRGLQSGFKTVAREDPSATFP